MTDSLTATRRFYDTIAKDYEAHFGDTLAGRPPWTGRSSPRSPS
ncbi:hypothetical protein GCM10020256_31420 [Streptomyces thermocoprophilus]